MKNRFAPKNHLRAKELAPDETEQDESLGTADTDDANQTDVPNDSTVDVSDANGSDDGTATSKNDDSFQNEKKGTWERGLVGGEEMAEFRGVLASV